MKAILFDLDGTLLPMDQELFVKAYLKLLAKHLMPKGYDPDLLVKAVWKGTEAMVKNNGDQLNEKVFWKVFAEIHGEEALKDKPYIDDFYFNDFKLTKETCGFNKAAREVIDYAKANFDKVILATNPIFPQEATFNRLRWAGLEVEDFDLVTTYENSSFCKPNPEYYKEIITKMGLDAKDCIMVGNDIVEDMAAKTLGMDGFVVTDCLINKKNEDVNNYSHGRLDELISWLENRK